MKESKIINAKSVTRNLANQETSRSQFTWAIWIIYFEQIDGKLPPKSSSDCYGNKGVPNRWSCAVDHTRPLFYDTVNHTHAPLTDSLGDAKKPGRGQACECCRRRHFVLGSPTWCVRRYLHYDFCNVRAAIINSTLALYAPSNLRSHCACVTYPNLTLVTWPNLT